MGRAELIEAEQLEIEHQFMNSFFQKGEFFWNLHKEKLKDYLCDKEEKKPLEWVTEITEGNVREFLTLIITTLVQTYSLTISLAIPLCGLAFKKGINNLCM